MYQHIFTIIILNIDRKQDFRFFIISCIFYLKKKKDGRDVFNHSGTVKLAPKGLDFFKMYCIGNFSLTLMRNQVSII